MIYTIGHSTRSIDEFIDLLKQYSIAILVDVRRFPGSKKVPHFNRENLDKTLEERAIKYFWLGDLLGGFRRRGYEAHTKTEEFRKIENLMQIMKQGTIAVMCAEIVWFRCHRRYISDMLVNYYTAQAVGFLAYLLVKLEYEVEHIVDGKKTYVHKLRKT